MTKIGILVHVYHLEAQGWEKLVWGDPARDELGTMTKFADCLLDIPMEDEVSAVIYNGPSTKDGLSEGAYTKRYLAERLKELDRFPRLHYKLQRLSAQERARFTERVHGLVVGPQIRDTRAEIESAAADFADKGITQVLQIAAVTHASRCVKLQAVARQEGLIPKDQEWWMGISDSCFADAQPANVVILEPAHRADDPVLGVHPSLPEILQRYQYELRPENRKATLGEIERVVSEALDRQAKNDVTQS